MKKIMVVTCILSISSFLTPVASAEVLSTTVRGEFWRIFASDELKGGCAAELNINIANVDGLQCGNGNYVHFNCKGLEGVNTRAEAADRFTVAQMAFLTESRVRIGISDRLVVNNACYVEWIDMQAPRFQ